MIDYRDWQVPLGRRFRALKLWFVIRHYGVEGLRHHVRRHVALAQEFSRGSRSRPASSSPRPRRSTWSASATSAATRSTENLLEAVNATGRLYLTHTSLDGRYTLRMSIGQSWTQERHVAEAWKAIQRLAIEVEPTV